MSLAQAAQILGARFSGADRRFTSVSTDSRSLAPGALFVALRGERFDGHDYIETAINNGAVGVLGECEPTADVPTLLVDNSLEALQALAAEWRARFHCTLIAVTGSNGKTTLKEMIGAILSAAAPTLVSAGNLNNHIGVPLSLLRLRKEHRYAVIEMGMNHAGELSLLSKLAAPQVAVINNAAAAHLEGLGSVERVAAAKGEIFDHLDEDGIAVVNADDAFAQYWLDLNKARRCVTFGFDADVNSGTDICADAEVAADHCLVTLRFADQKIRVRVEAGGEHTARNALAAAAVAVSLGISPEHIIQGLQSFRPVAGRGDIRMLPGGARLINDSYNANPASLAAAIDTLSRYPGKRILVLGDMGELGPTATQLHRETGELARGKGIDQLYCLGELSRHACDAFGDGASSFVDIHELTGQLVGALESDVTLLIKGSRSMRMERIVRQLDGSGSDSNGKGVH
jgi:UDP-N-acetylmuramoyl-tripeptide--D-alanyl-D-alanine ligase